MTQDEKDDFKKMEKDLQGLIFTQNINGRKLDEIINAIKGDDLGNKGMIERIIDNEKEIKSLKESRATDRVYAKIGLYLLTLITTSVVAASIKLFF